MIFSNHCRDLSSSKLITRETESKGKNGPGMKDSFVATLHKKNVHCALYT